MNLRILKKLSKRAAPLLPLLGDKREQFPNEAWEGCIGFGGFERKHLDRSSTKYPRDGQTQYLPRHGKQWVVLREPDSPWAGTPMLGAMSCGESPEWDEETTWEALRDQVFDYFTEYWVQGDEVASRMQRRLRTPAAIFRVLPAMIEEFRINEAEMRRQHAEWMADLKKRKAA